MLTTDERKELFIIALKEYRGNVTRACDALGMARQTYYNWRDSDEDFVENCIRIRRDQIESRLDEAEDAYAEVVLPGTPLIKFSEGNNNLRAARMNLIAAHKNLNQAYMLIAKS